VLNECVLLVTILASGEAIYIRRLSQQAPGRTTTHPLDRAQDE
jgi:hypothetical protein